MVAFSWSFVLLCPKDCAIMDNGAEIDLYDNIEEDFVQVCRSVLLCSRNLMSLLNFTMTS